MSLQDYLSLSLTVPDAEIIDVSELDEYADIIVSIETLDAGV